MLTGLVQHAHKARFLAQHHSPTILSGVAVAGTVVTAVLSGRASFKAAELIDEEKQLQEARAEAGIGNGPLTKTDKVKLVWKLYLYPAATGLLTITCIVVANKISSTRIAALGVAAGISERALQEYKEKVVEKLGARQDQKVRDEVAQDRVSNHPINNKEVILAGTGEVLFYDMLTGRYFQSTMEEVKRAENKINFEIVQFMSASLSQFCDEIGLPPTHYTDTVGWSSNNPIEVQFSTVLSPDNRPCIAMDFARHPTHDYDRLID